MVVEEFFICFSSFGVVVDEIVWAQVEAIAAGDINAKDIASC